ncbi:MAG TPA: NAD-dependent epimerase/dehydratase family protein [Candidatus Sulfotelmatobacter sp.]|nr:NAD-dependent epimerase/dehydratase family protein [Candidatus Sulfotelmatobacter sp.]
MNHFASYYRGLKVLVTGGLGFIGSNLARRLVDLGAEVLVVDSLLPNTGGNCVNLKDLKNRLRVKIVDLRNAQQIDSLVSGRSVIFNLAGTVSHLDSMTDPLSDMGANVHAQIVLLEACRHRAPDARIVFASTRQIYGRPISCPVDESHPIAPVDVNGINKDAAESYHSLYHNVYGMPTVSLRLTNTFGPRMRVKDSRQTFLGVWIRRAVENEVFEVWGGKQKRDLTYVDDAVEAFLTAGACSKTQGRIFNVGGSPPLTLTELAESLVAIAGCGRFEIKEFPPDRKRIDIGDYFANDEQFRQLTGWAPRVTLEEGLARTVSYFRDRLSDYV